jgi:hypothetical protein
MDQQNPISLNPSVNDSSNLQPSSDNTSRENTNLMGSSGTSETVGGSPSSQPGSSALNSSNGNGNPVNQPVATSGDNNDDSTKTIVTIILLFFFYPVGVVLMWLWMKWKTWVKVLITGLGCLSIIVPLLILGGAMFTAVNPQEQLSKANDTQTRSTAGELLNSLERYYYSNQKYPWEMNTTYIVPSPVGKPGTKASSVNWIAQGPDSLVGQGELSERFPDKDELSDIVIFYDQERKLPMVCFAPSSESDYIKTGWNEYGQIDVNGDYSCVGMENELTN